ncbi:MAG TPA: DUF721 domain-containing protein [Methylophilaceae bacterium]|jgi:hypothetical protein
MQRLNTIFGREPSLKGISAQAEKLSATQKIWAAIAPPPFGQQCHTGLVHDGQLTLYTSSGAVAAKLKLLIPNLLKKMQKHGLEVTSIRVEVQVKSQPRARIRERLPLSRNAAKKLLEFAQNLPDSPLQQALARMAKRVA